MRQSDRCYFLKVHIQAIRVDDDQVPAGKLCVIFGGRLPQQANQHFSPCRTLARERLGAFLPNDQ